MADRRNTNGRRQSRKRRQRAMTDALRLLLALILIAAAVFVVLFVRNELGSGLGFLHGTEKETEESTEESSSEAEPEEEAEGFNRDEEGRLYYLGEDGDRISDTWLSLEEKLYYLDEEGFAQTEPMSFEGMEYTFSEEGEVLSIKYDAGFRPDDEDTEEGYYSLIRDRRIWVYLDTEEKNGSFYLIKYRRTTEDTAYDLGGGNRQYTSPYSMQIDGNYIYYLPITDREEPEDVYTNGNLYRIQARAEQRELIAEDVEGYRVVDGDIYYQSGGRLRLTDHSREDTTVPDFSEVEDFRVDISAGDRAYLYTEDGRPVTQSSEEFKAGNFRYELASDGEILSVAEKTTVNTGGYTYSIEGDDAFGSAISRVVRTSDADGKKEIISSEFDGSCGNLHYDFDSGCMLAEYTDNSGKSRIIKITKDGDVDYLLDDGGGDGKLLLYAIQDHDAICLKEGSSGERTFVSLRIRASVPMALAVEPMEAGDDGEVIDIGSTTAASGETEELENVQAPTASSGGGTVVEGPGAGISAPGAGLIPPGDAAGPGVSSVITVPPG